MAPGEAGVGRRGREASAPPGGRGEPPARAGALVELGAARVIVGWEGGAGAGGGVARRRRRRRREPEGEPESERGRKAESERAVERGREEVERQGGWEGGGKIKRA